MSYMKNSQNSEPSTDLGMLAILSVRYCLGKTSYVVNECISIVVSNWNTFNKRTKSFIIKDIELAIKNNQTNRKQWLKILDLKDK